MGDTSRAAPPAAPRAAAAVILVRERPGSGEVEVYLQRRHRKASFMSSAFVFPGGAADPDETDPRVTAARELFEEAGVLLARPAVDPATCAEWRARLRGDRATGGLRALLAAAGAALDVDALRYFAHWITPSAEKKRFSARFYLARLPAGQVATVDNAEMVDAAWATPGEALARAGELRLPPPQLRTLLDMRDAARAGMEALFDQAALRATHPHPILPRLSAEPTGPGGRPVLLLPWDPAYRAHGTGEALDMPADHPLALGPSRFVLEDTTWRHFGAASSPSAG